MCCSVGDSIGKYGQVRVLQCVAMCCSVFQCVAVLTIVLKSMGRYVCWQVRVLQCVAVCCNVLQCVAMCFSELQCVAQ